MIITPEQLAKPDSESAHQQALFCWAALEMKEGRYQELKWLHHIPNGRERSKIDASRLKTEGVKAGVHDLFLPLARRGYHGLYIEMKAPDQRYEKNGGLSDLQLSFKQFIVLNSYCSAVCYSWIEGKECLQWYLT